MTTMIAEVYDALLEAGASQEKARKAAEAIAGYDDRFNRIERRLSVMQLQVGLLMAAFVPTLWLLVRVAAKVGALG